jgi:hypothetical protein
MGAQTFADAFAGWRIAAMHDGAARAIAVPTWRGCAACEPDHTRGSRFSTILPSSIGHATCGSGDEKQRRWK